MTGVGDREEMGRHFDCEWRYFGRCL